MAASRAAKSDWISAPAQGRTATQIEKAFCAGLETTGFGCNVAIEYR
jgi:hypothetical protein